MGQNLVIVRAFGGKAAIRAVLSSMPGGVLVCLPEHVESIRSGERPEPMLGVSKANVFAYDVKAAEIAKNGGNPDWSKLRPAMA